MYFRDVIGQDTVKQALLAQCSAGRVPHALLFSGPAGCGKLPMALALARYLLCSNPGAGDACGHCRACKMIDNSYEHPDLHFAFPIVKKGSSAPRCDDYLRQWNAFISSRPYFLPEEWFDEIKAGNSQPIIYANESDEIIRKMSFKSAMGGYKLLVVWLPEKMHLSCANKLLKLFEEPQGAACIIMVTDDKASVLGTIASRAQEVIFKGIEATDMVRALEQGYGLDADAAAEVAERSGGSFAKCIKAIEASNASGFMFDNFVRLMRLSYSRDVRELKAWSDSMSELGRERQKAFFEYSQRMLRENFIHNFHIAGLCAMDERESAFASRFAPFINERNVVSIMQKMSDAASGIEGNVNAKMVFFDFALKMIVEIAVKGARR